MWPNRGRRRRQSRQEGRESEPNKASYSCSDREAIKSYTDCAQLLSRRTSRKVQLNKRLTSFFNLLIRLERSQSDW
jgi:hypothetical protein